jgi:hypothetical protein
MGDRSDQGLPQDLAEMGELLRESRARPTALELDAIKLQATARARRRSPHQLRRGVSVRSRGVTLILALLLIGGTTAGGIAGGNHDGNDDGGAANAQYKPPKCTKDMRKCECPKGYHLTSVNNQIVCERNPGDGGHGGGDDEGGHGGHGHHHHHNWHQGGNGHWQWCDDGKHWNNWNGRDDDW